MSARFPIALIFSAVLLYACTPVESALSTGGESPEKPLFIETSGHSELEPPNDPTIQRYRITEINLASLEQGNPGDRLPLNLFDDVILTAILDRKEDNKPHGYTWFAHIDGQQNSHATLVVGGGQIAANITLASAAYQVRYAGENNLHWIFQIDQSAFPPEDEPVQPGE